jgi:hypothetical protein
MALAEKEETYQYKDKEYDNTDGVSMEQEYSGSA